MAQPRETGRRPDVVKQGWLGEGRSRVGFARAVAQVMKIID